MCVGLRQSGRWQQPNEGQEAEAEAEEGRVAMEAVGVRRGRDGAARRGRHGTGARAERIQVVTRLRPERERERVAGEDEPAAEVRRVMLEPEGGIRVGGHAYRFDATCGASSAQEDIFGLCGAPLVDAVCEGLNAALIAYGQTGSGKTYSMLGGEDMWQRAARAVREGKAVAAPSAEQLGRSAERGVIPRALERIFRFVRAAEVEAAGTRVDVRCSYVEIYNEKVYDLLAGTADKRALGERGLDIHEDAFHGVHVPGLVEAPVREVQHVVDLLWRGALRRAVDATDMNEYSSRSHTIFQVVLEQRREAAPGRRLRSKLNLVDLAGSEKWRTHQLAAFSDQRIQEMTSINQSLSNLGNCIRALLLPKRGHVPYRNSKLTRMLKDSLGGNSKTSFLVTLSPAASCVEESISSLQFADRAKRVLVHVAANERADDAALVKQLERRVRSLEAQLSEARTGCSGGEALCGGRPSTAGSSPPPEHDAAALLERVEAAARQLERWRARAGPRGGRQAAALDEEATQALYEEWLVDRLVRSRGGEEDRQDEILTAEDRLAMAEWAVLLQARRLAAIK